MKMISLKEDFIEQITQKYSSTIISDHVGADNSVTGKQILKLTQSKQINFFIVKILFQQWQDEMKKLESPYFNYKTIEVRKAMVDLMNILSQNIEVQASDLGALIEKAFYQALLLYINPAEYLIEELIDKRDSKLTDKLSSQLTKYLVYQKSEISEFTQQVREMPVEEVISLTGGYFEDYDSIEGLDLFIKEIIDIVDINLEDFVKVEDKAEPEYIRTEETIESEEFEPEIEVDDEIEESYSDYNDEETPDEEEDEIVEEINDIEEDEINDEDNLNAEDKSEEETQVEEKEIENSAKEINEDLVKESTESTLNDKFGIESKTLADVHEEKKISNIMEAISINHKYMFLQELFDGDNEVFQKAVIEIEERKTFDAAVEFLVQNYAKEFFWDMNSDEVKEFLKVIFRYFR